ncbi:hypothetical protein SAMN05444166_6123 [Singulisphaera sp. GP187]|uniref:hypothetical protein n=1 Tax=Singulisphaera sp. GP187 TaxID=1882752 RepID=UPI000925AD2D|nr:hypothetical protein [Singulisphaera sp. GP187]SIO59633.1 hypothetical protein SAMN05444166_6123 [Singulisphaera sp. GP187]
MHQLILLTALTATSGLFGGGRQQCGTSRCGRPTLGFSACAPRQQCAQPQPQFSACQPGTACGTAAPAAYPTYAAPQAPVAAPQAAPQAAFYPSFYGPAGASNCAGGSCARR